MNGPQNLRIVAWPLNMVNMVTYWTNSIGS